MTPLEDTKQRLLDAAAQVFAERGFGAATVREICARAKANVAAVNYHFRDKEQLYAETLRRAHCMRLEEVPVPQWPAGTPPEEKLRGFIQTMIERLVDQSAPPWFMQLMLREMTQPSTAGFELVKEFIKPQFDLLQEIIMEMVGEDLPAIKRHMIGFSIVGQCLYYKIARHIALTLVGEEEFQLYDGECLTQHILEFSLAALGRQQLPDPPRKMVTT